MGSAEAPAPVFIALCLRGRWGKEGGGLAKLDINSNGLKGISGVIETDVIFAATASPSSLHRAQFYRDATLTPAASERHCTPLHEETEDDAALTLCQITSHRPLGVTVPIWKRQQEASPLVSCHFDCLMWSRPGFRDCEPRRWIFNLRVPSTCFLESLFMDA